MVTVYLDSEIKIDKSIIVKIAKKIREVFGEEVLPKDQGIAQYKYIEPNHTYEFNLHSDISESDSEKLASIFYYVVPHDFELEIDIEIPEDGIPEEEEYEEISEATKHELWMQSKISEGWRYGMNYNKDDKTDPCLRPYYQLTEKQLSKLKGKI